LWNKKKEILYFLFLILVEQSYCGISQFPNNRPVSTLVHRIVRQDGNRNLDR